MGHKEHEEYIDNTGRATTANFFMITGTLFLDCRKKYTLETIKSIAKGTFNLLASSNMSNPKRCV